MQYEEYAHRISIYIFKELPNGKRLFCTDINTMEFIEHEEHLILEKPTLSLSGNVAKPFIQEIVDSAKRIGINPSGEPILENELIAIKYHLEDMRTLVFTEEKIINMESKK
jgi:hypothetical protein